MRHVSLKTTDLIQKILPETLEKDLQDGEELCPTCHGLGIVIDNNIYGIKGDTSEIAKIKRFPYNHQAVKFCPTCFNGVVNICKYCGKQLVRGRLTCDCKQQKEKEENEKKKKYQETIEKAKEIDISMTNYYMYDEQSDHYFTDENEFAEYWWDCFLNNDDEDTYEFDAYFEKYVPKILWNCSETKLSLDADDILESACEELHEDAMDNISSDSKKLLQQFLDTWCKEQTGTTTYYPCYDEYVAVKKEWFEK